MVNVARPCDVVGYSPNSEILERSKMAAKELSMSEEHRKILRENRSILERDLQAIQLLKYLTEVLSTEDEEDIRAGRTLTDQATKLLDTLPRKGASAFFCFVNALWKVQKHLAHILSQKAGLQEPSGIDGE